MGSSGWSSEVTFLNQGTHALAVHAWPDPATPIKALVLMGGADVDPHLYGQQRQPHVYGVNPEQDQFEMALVHAAIEMRLPTLAVCRGIQLVNVALGGSLIQHIGDIPGVVQHAPGKFPAGQEYVLHDVEITPRTKLSKAIGSTSVNVASFHHQGIDRVGTGLKVVARSSDGLVEGLEHTGRDQWLIGVQWHPEDLTEDPQSVDLGIFRAFADAMRTPGLPNRGIR